MRRWVGSTVLAIGCGPLVELGGSTGESGAADDLASLDDGGDADADGVPPDPSSPGDPSVDPDPSADDASSVSVGDDSTGQPPTTTCGDGILDHDEACDDGDLDDGDGCSSSCTFESAPLWTASYNGPASSLDVFEDVLIAPDGSIYAVGTHRVVEGDADLLLQQYGPDGSVGWTFSYAGPDGLADSGAAVASTADGQLAVVGSTASMATGDDVLVLMVDAGTGVMSWANSFDGSSSGPGEYDDRDRGSGIAVDFTGNLVVAGTVRSEVDGDDSWLAAVEPVGGALAWSMQLDFSKHEQVHAVAVDAFGTLALLVEHDSDHAALTTFVTDAGEYLDVTLAHDFAAHDFAARGEGGLVVGGIDDSGSGRELVAAAFDSNYAPLWQDEEHAANGADIVGIASGPSSEIAVTGSRDSSGEQSNAWVRVDGPDGVPWWSDTYDGSASLQDAFRAAAFDVDGSLVVVGSETVLGEQTNAIVRRYPAF